MEKDAKAYDEMRKPQIESGSQFIRELSLSQGDKILDMGCGTGNLTKYIADIVGAISSYRYSCIPPCAS
jgi:cyclopropane fatty-acyl-phospholipid synthase-like methyltransferase